MKPYDDFHKVSPVREARLPEDRRSRNPLITEAGFHNFLRLKQHPHAPLWNFETGDRVETQDKADFHRFCETLNTARKPPGNRPSLEMIEWIRRCRSQVAAFQKQIPEGFDIERNWDEIPMLCREDISLRIETLVPLDADLSRLIVYDTSGTTGHPLVVPHHPAAVAKVLGMIEYVMQRYRVKANFSPHMTACLNVGAQAQTVVFPNVLSVWEEAGFAKVNLHPESWRSPEDVRHFFRDMEAFCITGDPVGFSEMVRWDINVRPKIMLTTALFLPKTLQERLQQKYACPVVDWYSITEVGPVGYMCPYGSGFHILPHDLYVEIVGPTGHPLPPGEFGEIVVSGGRNPFLPLLRYRTGDWAKFDFTPCPCGDPMPKITSLEGREPVLFFADNMQVVNPVDIGRLLRGVAFVQHEFVQRADLSCDLTIRPMKHGKRPDPDKIKTKLKLLFGEDTVIRIRMDKNLGERMAGGHVSAYRSEIPLGAQLS
ncbi:AMP-binding protein [Thermodesulfobacteriota bacterium]